MSVPAEAYVFGVQIALLIPIMVFVVLIINKIFIPVFYHNHIANCYEVSLECLPLFGVFLLLKNSVCLPLLSVPGTALRKVH